MVIMDIFQHICKDAKQYISFKVKSYFTAEVKMDQESIQSL